MQVETFDDQVISPRQAVNREVIRHVTKPVLDWVERPEVSEVAINRPFEIWLKLRKPDENGNVWIRRKDERLDYGALSSMFHYLANVSRTKDFGPLNNPVSHGTLPGGHRYCCGYGPAFQYYSGEMDIAGTCIFVCRQQHVGREISFEDYGLERGKELAPYDIMGERKSDGSDPIGRLLNSISRGDHVLISGGTDTGKTTLLNNMLGRLPKRLRIITVEDASEIRLQQPNHIHVIVPRGGATTGFTYQAVVDLIVRTTPDVVVAGEISTTNGAAIWELMRTGHGSFMATIHADDPATAISTFMTRIAHSDKEEVSDRKKTGEEMMRRMRIVQIMKDPRTNKRTIVDVL